MRTSTGSPRHTAPALAAAAAVLLFGAACTSGSSGAGRPTGHPRPSAPAAASVPVPATASPASADDTVLRDGRTGNGSVTYGKGRKGDALWVEYSCLGKGEIRISLWPDSSVFTSPCEAGKVTDSGNEIAVTGAERGGTATVTVPAGMRWTLKVSHHRPSPTEEPDADGEFQDVE